MSENESEALDLGLELLADLAPNLGPIKHIKDAKGTIGYVLSDGSFFIAKGYIPAKTSTMNVDKELIFRAAKSKDVRIVMFLHSGNKYRFYEIQPASLIKGFDSMKGGKVMRNFPLNVAVRLYYKQ